MPRAGLGTGAAVHPSEDPRRSDEKHVQAYQRIALDTAGNDLLTYVAVVLSIIGMIFKHKYVCWMSLYCSVVHLANSKTGSRQSTLLISAVTLMMCYNSSPPMYDLSGGSSSGA